jgi:hypothetical protein
MGLFQRLFTRRRSTIGRQLATSSRGRAVRFTFECLEDRRVMDAEAFDLIGVDDYQSNAEFA